MPRTSTPAHALPYEVDTLSIVRNLTWTEMRNWVVRTTHSLAAKYAKRRRVKRATAELSALSDRMLADMGIRRSEISRIVRYGRDAERLA